MIANERRHTMTLNQLRYFCTACRTRSITKAAAELYVTQPAVSIAIKELEEEFDLTLFSRSGNRLELTSAGESFYEQAQAFLRHADEMQSEFAKLGNRCKTIKVGIPPMLSTIFFPDLLNAFRATYPVIPVELDEYGSVRACNLVNEEKLDLGLVNMEQYNIDKFERVKILKEQLVYVVDPSHPKAKNGVMRGEDFAGERILMFNGDSVQNQLLKVRFESAAVNPQIVMRSSQIYTTLQFIRQGDCGCFLYSDMLKLFPRYVGLPLDPPITADIGIVWKKGSFLSPQMQLFIDFTKKYYSEETEEKI